jgi:PLP dependent protein
MGELEPGPGELYLDFLSKTPSGVCLLAVSKNHPAEAILDVYNQGCRDFGENKVQELVAKHEALPKDINWHYIGHLQTNKVKYIIPFVHLIHGVDSVRLLEAINKEAGKHQLIVKCLLQAKIAKEDSKFGFSLQDLKILATGKLCEFQNISISGLMGMATNTEDAEEIDAEFQELACLFREFKSSMPQPESFNYLSMGMSSDAHIAISRGSTMIRVGTAIFGSRRY